MSIKKSNVREISYSAAISEALCQAMAADKNVYILGIGVTDYKGIFGTTIEANKRFGRRVIEIPASENAVTGVAIGSAAFGKRPVVVHARNDFMFLTLDQMINTASKWKYMYNGKTRVPIVIRGIIGKGWGQGPTHSQSIQSVFMHFPGINLMMPSTPYDAKGCILTALKLDSPTVILEHRSLYDSTGRVPENMYQIDIKKARSVLQGGDITIVAVSYMVREAMRAAMALKKQGISAEIIDPRVFNPLDEDAIIRSVRKTGRLMVCDTSWVSCGVSSEIAGMIAEKAYDSLKAPVKRIGVKDCPAPVSRTLETIFYPDHRLIFREACGLCGKKADMDLVNDPVIDNFNGPY